MKVGLMRMLPLFLAVLFSTQFIACAGEGSSSDAPGATAVDPATTGGADAADGATQSVDGVGQTDAADGADGATGTEVTPPPTVTCLSKPAGVIVTPEADIIYQNNSLTASATHVEGLGCVNTMDLIYEIDGGCRMVLKFETIDSGWKLIDGSFDADAKCGELFPASQMNNYLLDAEKSNAAIVGHPDSVDDASTSDSCLTSPKFHVVGWAQFAVGTTSLVARFSGLGVKGAVHSVAVAGGSCPTAFEPCSDGKVCGSNAYGYNCGGCSGGLECISGYCSSKASNCNALGTGKKVGDNIANITWIDSNLKELPMHNWCGDTAIWLIKTAGW